MEKKIFKTIVLLSAGIALLSACDLTETQKSNADAALIFGSETGLRLYSNSFYDFFPNGTAIHHQDETMCDYMAKTELGDYELGALISDTQGKWGWSNIRSVNYFLDHNKYESVPEDIRDNYNGIARFFRAWLYFDKLFWYGGVPWIDHVLNPGDPELTAPRDSRDVIVTHIMEDCDYAFQHIKADNSSSSKAGFVNKWCALLLKSRVCLYEASWRKYHAGTAYVAGCSISSEELFTAAADAAKAVMESGVFSIHNGTSYNKGKGSYRDLFSSETVPFDEVLLAVEQDNPLSVGYANYYYNKQNVRASLVRPFINTYLNQDGSYYSETKPDGKYKTFVEEMTGRDQRLAQTIRSIDYERKNADGNLAPATADYGFSLTGYHIIKFTVDDDAADAYGANGNDIPIMRYAEALLNYAEAKAELGTITDEDWKITVGALRRRAGITGGALDTKPTTVDNYLQNTFYPGIIDPVILEIRRERTIELCLEGFRLKDLKRWACGNLWADLPWTGICIPGYDTPLDMNGDGTPDVYFPDPKMSTVPDEYTGIAVSVGSPLQFISVPGGLLLRDNLQGRVWNDRMYLDPISSEDITMNGNLEQNPGY